MFDIGVSQARLPTQSLRLPVRASTQTGQIKILISKQQPIPAVKILIFLDLDKKS